MNICLCGTEAGYLHDPTCPYPYFADDDAGYRQWVIARSKKQLAQMKKSVSEFEVELRDETGTVEHRAVKDAIYYARGGK